MLNSIDVAPYPFAGPLHNLAGGALRRHIETALYSSGAISRLEYCAFIDRIAPELVLAGVPADEIHFVKRYPANAHALIDSALDQLRESNVISADRCDRET